ncbi:hypothetical protein ACFPRL_16320 [Pseudoclavibacter helvolus]
MERLARPLLQCRNILVRPCSSGGLAKSARFLCTCAERSDGASVSRETSTELERVVRRSQCFDRHGPAGRSAHRR